MSTSEPTLTRAQRIVGRFRHHEDWEILTLEISHALEDAHNAGHEVLTPRISIPCDDEWSRQMTQLMMAAPGLQAEIERLQRQLSDIHEITQDNSVPAWSKLQNIEATARCGSPLTSPSGTEGGRD